MSALQAGMWKAALLAAGCALAPLPAQARQTPAAAQVRLDPAAEVQSAVYYMASVADALRAEHSEEIRGKDARIRALEAQLGAARAGSAEAASLAAELARLQRDVVDQLAARDAELARQVAAFRAAVEDIASTPEGAAILAQRRPGNLRQARELLIDLEARMAAAEQKAADVRSAARLRSIATIALDDRNRGEATTAEVIALYEKVTALDGLHWDWVELGRLHTEAGNLPKAKNAALRAAATAGDDRDRSAALDALGDVLVRQGNLADALKAFRDSLAIRTTLARSDPGNAGWQRDLIVSNVKLADITGDNAYNLAALKVAQDMASRGTLAPVDAWMIPDLKRRAGAQ